MICEGATCGDSPRRMPVATRSVISGEVLSSSARFRFNCWLQYITILLLCQGSIFDFFNVLLALCPAPFSGGGELGFASRKYGRTASFKFILWSQVVDGTVQPHGVIMLNPLPHDTAGVIE